MTLAELIAAAEQRAADAVTARQTSQSVLLDLRSRVEAGDDTVTVEAIDTAAAARDAADAAVDRTQAEVDKLRGEEARDAEVDALASQSHPTGVTRNGQRLSYDAVIRVGQEPRTYTRDSDTRARGTDFLTDVARGFRGDWQAQDRLNRHMREEQVERGNGMLERATGTGAFTGYVVPQYLVDLNVGQATTRRPFADICNSHDLPASGMTVHLSKITTGSSVAAQSSENAAVSETDMDDTLVSISVQTAAGSQTISRQAIERGLGVEEVTVADLLKRYATNLDSTILNQTTNGLTNVATGITYTDADPTGAEFYPKVAAAASGAEGIFLNDATVDYVVMHSRRWRWLTAQMTSTWPLVSGGGAPPQSGASQTGVGYDAGIKGYLPDGTPVIVDNNIATTLGAGTQDEVYAVASEECHLWEDPAAPMLIRAEQTRAKNLGIDLVLYGYFAYYLDRYAGGHHKVGGTGLAAPTFP